MACWQSRFPRDDPYSIGITGGLATASGAAALCEVDLLIAAGALMAHHTSMGGKLCSNAKTLRIDNAPATLRQGRVAAEMTIRADAARTLQAFAEAARTRPADWRSDELAERLRGPVFDQTPERANGVHSP
ncbi:hypothetical protein [Paracoccus litorisediminis]|jgi:thiamine pyrophosphate-dependent acetolactate synthase large subunit-like protein|uniref:Thiamine pyrophosphate enzyme central domain-containing protein n=1 Tax=Paracoccus litorisediminis TaxID=2006130 RepID=A0A844HTK3_9RHOB|nr:hypothetical protein [Paracoccus litorisediminis]MTH61545.1 hypothetical protein [Paracoccus litorisediminis]